MKHMEKSKEGGLQTPLMTFKQKLEGKREAVIWRKNVSGTETGKGPGAREGLPCLTHLGIGLGSS